MHLRGILHDSLKKKTNKNVLNPSTSLFFFFGSTNLQNLQNPYRTLKYRTRFEILSLPFLSSLLFFFFSFFLKDDSVHSGDEGKTKRRFARASTTYLIHLCPCFFSFFLLFFIHFRNFLTRLSTQTFPRRSSFSS